LQPAVEIFSFFAIGTSFIGFVLGLSDFLADLLKMPSGQEKRQPLPYLLTLVPPYALALTNPEIFYKALDFAGAYGGKLPLDSLPFSFLPIPFFFSFFFLFVAMKWICAWPFKHLPVLFSFDWLCSS
jgi:hypothetical protein